MGNTKDANSSVPPVSTPDPIPPPPIGLPLSKAQENKSSISPTPVDEPPPVFPMFGSHSSAPMGESLGLFTDTVESLHQEFKSYSPNYFEGAKLTLNSPLSQFFQAVHTLQVSPRSNTYSYGISYVGQKKYGEMEYYPMLYGEMDNAANLKSIIVHRPYKKLKLRTDIQTQKAEFSVVQLMSEYMGSDFSLCSTLVNPSFHPLSGVLAVQYLQRVTDRISLGIDFTYQKDVQMQGAGVSGFLGFKFPGWQAFAKLGIGTWSIGYIRKVSDTINLYSEFERNPMDESSVASFGYSWSIPKTEFKISSSVNSLWTISTVVEKRLQPLPVTLALAACLNQKSNQLKLGVGITIG